MFSSAADFLAGISILLRWLFLSGIRAVLFLLACVLCILFVFAPPIVVYVIATADLKPLARTCPSCESSEGPAGSSVQAGAATDP